MSKNTANLGFTMIEVLIALAILAISLTALLSTEATSINIYSRIKNKAISHIVEMQMITKVKLGEIRIQDGLATTIPMKAFGKTWYARLMANSTSINHMHELNIDVSSSPYGPFDNNILAFYYE
ncbi:MAG: type II secretion system protein GspI [Legionellales bacterium RIFCSPHIGHO2_12_FULL_35_11]|nr:MAG: type II secretion system protein GspI [Legionellales bacterium RIFCSPHIGHO2_12_FULL_35_11]